MNDRIILRLEPQINLSSQGLKEQGTEPAIPTLSGEWFIHFTIDLLSDFTPKPNLHMSGKDGI